MEKGTCHHIGCYAYGKYCRIPGHTVLQKKEEKVERVARKKSLKQFYDEMLQNAPAHCEETGKKLKIDKINPRTNVMHILPKRKAKDGGVPSMAVDERNVVYVNEPIHTAADTQGEEYVTKMALFPHFKEMVASMYNQIPFEERKNIPDYLRPK